MRESMSELGKQSPPYIRKAVEQKISEPAQSNMSDTDPISSSLPGNEWQIRTRRTILALAYLVYCLLCGLVGPVRLRISACLKRHALI